MINWIKYTEQVAKRFGDKQPMAQKIRHLILAAIADQALAPGMRLIETELGEQLKVSRTPLREAMAGLKADGILNNDDDGIRVRKLGWSDVTSLYEMRANLEGMAARLAATRASVAEKNVINTICRDEQAMIEQGANPNDLAKINTRLHHSILSAAGNPFLTESYDKLTLLLILLGVTAYSLPSRVHEIRQEHEDVNQAIKSGQAMAAEQTMSRHLTNALEARLILMGNARITEMN